MKRPFRCKKSRTELALSVDYCNTKRIYVGLELQLMLEMSDS
jgi:hypothetical protein